MLARWACLIEEHYSNRRNQPTPMDMVTGAEDLEPETHHRHDGQHVGQDAKA